MNKVSLYYRKNSINNRSTIIKLRDGEHKILIAAIVSNWGKIIDGYNKYASLKSPVPSML